MVKILGKILLVSTLKSSVGGGTAAFMLLNKFPLIEGGGGGGCGLGPPSKKSSIEGKLSGSPPGLGGSRTEVVIIVKITALSSLSKPI